MRIISVNIVMTYPVHWTKYQVLRDFAQNFYDAVGFDDWHQNFNYDYSDGKLSMWIKDVSFSYEWLLHIGASTKTSRSDEYAGFFGEGFKIASLCAFRDYRWDITMMSEDWNIDVAEMERTIDSTPVKMLAYKISSIERTNETKLILNNVSEADYGLFQDIIDSFFFPENPIMGKRIWQGKEGAVFLRSKIPIRDNLPVTKEFGSKGAVFCGFQLLGTNPFDLVVCLHRYKKQDRERRGLYSFEIIDVFEEIVRYVSPECAMIMLEKMRRYWNSYPRKTIDISSWSGTVDRLIRKISFSPDVRNDFVSKYDNILCLKKVLSNSERNRRWQARAWVDRQEKKYILAKETFGLLGYPSIEEECDKHDGFVTDDIPDELQQRCFTVLEGVCKEVFKGFFPTEVMPERRIITNLSAPCRGMAEVYKKKQHRLNSKGIKERYDIGRLYLKSDIFQPERYYTGLSTYVHEMCHVFGGDASASFNRGLTYAIELLMTKREEVDKGEVQWNRIFEKRQRFFVQRQQPSAED